MAQQLHCPAGYYWAGQMCLPLGVIPPSSSKLVAWLDYGFDCLSSTAGLVTLAVLLSISAIWYFRQSLQASFAGWVFRGAASQPDAVLDRWAKAAEFNRRQAARAAAAVVQPQPAGGEGAAPPNGGVPERY